ncbi:MAG: hypothetical protein LBF50_09985 [Azoarcus sp.]|jgi:hypothetical protein|nr:hypothetical protein [Azoarcus sp.]
MKRAEATATSLPKATIPPESPLVPPQAATAREFADVNRRREYDYTVISVIPGGYTGEEINLVLWIAPRLRKGPGHDATTESKT